jgi:hypothetical protein
MTEPEPYVAPPVPREAIVKRVFIIFGVLIVIVIGGLAVLVAVVTSLITSGS